MNKHEYIQNYKHQTFYGLTPISRGVDHQIYPRFLIRKTCVNHVRLNEFYAKAAALVQTNAPYEARRRRRGLLEKIMVVVVDDDGA